MQLPFTAEQFFDVFRRYNEAVWPAQIGLIGVGLFAAFAAYRANVRRSWRWARVALALLAALWLWSGIVYHKMFFASMTPAGEIFGSFFIAQAGLLLLCLWQNGSTFEPASRANIVASVVLIAYALLLYPIVGHVLGQRYPAMPTFGAPCPTTIFTFGVFCLLPAIIPRFAIVVPILWTLIASYAALGFGVYEDLGLIVAAITAIVVIHHARSLAMRKGSFVTALVSLAFLFISCASSEPGPVQVIGLPEDLVTLTGEWAGTYESGMTGRSGSITFHLTENPDGAHGDVLMVPKQEFVHDGERHPQGMFSSSGGGVSVLSIEFVRISGGEISGKIAPYADPEVSGAMLETHFTGRMDGEWIEGTFVTYSDYGVSPRRGTWRVHRKPAV